jgi:hypothetical protein
MSSLMKWWPRAAAAVTGVILTLVVPAHAWAASTGVDQIAVEAARYRRRGGIGAFGILGGLCCLLVVAGIVLAVILISRNRKRRGS